MKNDGLQLTNQGKALDVKKKELELADASIGTEEHMAAVMLKGLKQLGLIPDES